MAKLITYDLMSPGKDYKNLIDAIKSFPMWCKVTESCWIVSSSLTCNQIATRLSAFIDNNDRLFVALLSGEASWTNVVCSDDYLKKILKE